MAKINRQRFVAQPDDPEIILERRQVCASLVGFSNGSPGERAAHRRAVEAADRTLEQALSDRETVRRHDGDPKALPWFAHGSLHYFELIMDHIAGRSS
jgi:hypothetical protein